MAVSVFNVILVLALSFVTLGECSSVTCKTDGAETHDENGKTASSHDWDFTAHVDQNELYRCFGRCETYCKEEGPRGIENWPNCKAFSAFVERGGTCHCYGWASVPEWYPKAGYDSGWCEN